MEEFYHLAKILASTNLYKNKFMNSRPVKSLAEGQSQHYLTTFIDTLSWDARTQKQQT